MKTTLRRDIRACRNPERAVFCQRYFKTGKGEYGEGDCFLGLDAKTMHRLARQHRDTPLDAVEDLLHSSWHEERLVALLILVEQVTAVSSGKRRKAGAAPLPTPEAICALYLANTGHINNWDLVDCSAPQIVGPQSDLKLLRKLARSPSLWERRIAIMATFHDIRRRDFTRALAIAELLLHDPEDLIHKATGWMLREISNRDREVAKRFLDTHATTMPRTMLRYAIERLPEKERKAYLAK